MSERTSYDARDAVLGRTGGTPDIEAGAGFYGELFGWEMPGAAELGRTGRLPPRRNWTASDVAGVAPLMQEGQPPAWSTYVSVERRRRDRWPRSGEAGGTVIVEPMDVMGLGTMAVFTDPTGAVFGVWQPGTFAGAELVNEYGAFGWNELGTRDAARRQGVLRRRLRLGLRRAGHGGDGRPTPTWKVGEAMVGGMFDISGVVPDEVPAHWLVYFVVEDTDAAVEKVNGGGGDVRIGPIDIPTGRFAVVADQFGAVFAVMQRNEETLAEARSARGASRGRRPLRSGRRPRPRPPIRPAGRGRRS